MKTKQEFLDRKIASKKSRKVIEIFDSIIDRENRSEGKRSMRYFMKT